MYRIRIEIALSNAPLLQVAGDLISFECTENSRDGNCSLMPGVVEQEAKIVLYDREDLFKSYAMQYDIDVFQGAGVSIYCDLYEGEQASSTETLGMYIIEQIDLEGDSNEVTIRCTDTTKKLSDIKINQYPVSTNSGEEVLQLLFEQYLGISTSQWEYENDQVRDLCRLSTIEDYYLNKTDAREVLDQLCYALMLRIYYKNGMYKVGLSV